MNKKDIDLKIISLIHIKTFQLKFWIKKKCVYKVIKK